MMRYFGAAMALPELRLLIESVKHKNCLPSDVNLGGTYDIGLVLSVLEHLAPHFSRDYHVIAVDMRAHGQADRPAIAA